MLKVLDRLSPTSALYCQQLKPKKGLFLRAGINPTDGKNIALERGNLTVQKEIIAAGVVPALIKPAAAAAVSYTIAQLLTGFIRRDPDGAARADLVPTAASIVAGIENVFVGATFDFTISNEGSVTEIITVTTAAGITLGGTMTIDGGDQRRFRVEVTNVTTPAVEIRSLGQGIEGLLATTLEMNTALDGILATATEINEVCDMDTHVVAPATGDLTLTAALHGNRILYYDDADGNIVLPAATGTGYTYTIIFKTAFTGGTIKCASASDSFLGGCTGTDSDADGTAFGFLADPNDDTVTLNGVATGGIAGDHLIFRDVASGLFHVSGHLTFSGGSEVTPFSATVA